MTPVGIAIDLVGQNLYWTDFSTKKIEVASVKGYHRKVLAIADQPRDIILDTARG